MKIRRNKIKKQISLFITGDLSPKKRENIEGFVKTDPCFAEEYGSLQNLIKNIAKIKAVKPRQGFEKRIKESIIISQKSAVEHPFKRLYAVLLPSAIALILISFLVFLRPEKRTQKAEEWLVENIESIDALNGYSEFNLNTLEISELSHFDDQLQKVIDTDFKDAKQIVKETDAYLEWNAVFQGLLKENNESARKKSEEL
jgi:hypothetical protein